MILRGEQEVENLNARAEGSVALGISRRRLQLGRRLHEVSAFMVVAVIVAVLTVVTPIMSDDFANVLRYYGERPGDIGISDFLANLPSWSTYMKWLSSWYHHENGRFASACALLIASGLPHWLFALVNGLFAGVLVVEIAWLMRRTGWKVWMAAGLFFAVMLNHESCLWMAGAVNYLWASALTLCLVRIFLSPLMEGRAYLVRNLWMWFLLPVSFFVAGFQELFCAQIALLLFVYWMPRLIRMRIPFDGRFIMSLGYFLGTLPMLYSPTVSNRSSVLGVFRHQGVVAEIARRVVSSFNTAFCNPFIVVLAALILISLIVPRVRHRTTRLHWLVAVSSLLSLIMVDWVFGLGGYGREVFVATLCAIVGLAWFGDLLLQGRIRIMASGLIFVLAIVTVSVTFVKQMDKANFAAKAVKAWIESGDIFIVRERPEESRIGHWIDRSFTYSQFSMVGDGWGNQRLSDFYFSGKRKCFGISRPEYNALKNGCRGFARLDIEGDWYASPELDIIVTPGSETGESYFAYPDYRSPSKSESPLDLLLNRITRNGWGDVPSLAPDAEIRCNARLQGYVFYGSNGKWLFFFHNRHVNRNLIKRLSYSCK